MWLLVRLLKVKKMTQTREVEREVSFLARKNTKRPTVVRAVPSSRNSALRSYSQCRREVWVCRTDCFVLLLRSRCAFIRYGRYSE